MRDLSLHILDLVQNSLEAGGKNITLTVVEDTEKDWLTFSVTDDGRGMTPEFAGQARDPFTTSRTTRKVGLGLSLIDMSTRRAGGGLSIKSRPGQGAKITAVYRYSHIDRPPLGDIAQTVKIIVISYQQIFFRYEHSKNGRSFLLDTKRIREILGEGADFSSPEVAAWLDGYLSDGLSALNSTEGKT
jgi:anti-sigma regulatory factor (Ser/Thr protein kinase)